MQQVFNEYPALFGTDDILYHIGRYLEVIANRENSQSTVINQVTGNYGDSLIFNGAFELGNINGWQNVNINGTYEGLGIGENNIAGSNSLSDFFYFNPNILYKITFFGSNVTGLSIKPFTNQNIAVNNTITSNPYTFILPYVESGNTSSNQLNKIVAFFGGKANNSAFSSISTAKKARVSFYVNAGQTVQFTNLIVKEIELGEPVPYTLPYLPVGQFVYDPATNDVGRFNGTDINWFM